MKQKLLRHIIITALLFIGISSFGQQEPMFTQYMNNPQLINPAYAGSLGNINIDGIFRKQWMGTGVEWAPTTTSLSVNAPFMDYRVGIGLNFMIDDIGPLDQISIFTDYAYHLEFDNGSKLSLGLKGGFYSYQEDLANLSTFEYDEWLYDGNSITNKFFLNFGVGAYYYSEKYFVGLSFPKLVRNSLSEAYDTYEVLGSEERHMYLTAGLVFDISPLLKFKPTAMLRRVNGAPYSTELTATVIFVDQVWFGLMYRFGDALAAHVKFQIDENLHIGYSYDLTTTELKPYNSGTHEIFFSYTIKKKGKRILSPRYF
ncbi:MAG: type IX secretion system membrane protein PorP/SprF [Prolixibacteraceae bacterium]|jgi:type IX secretion system PorP/SprF family membrane protein|nr:type IX secretion system membrane protein PorP/SprF [Prolixibacteraceae bacterium]